MGRRTASSTPHGAGRSAQRLRGERTESFRWQGQDLAAYARNAHDATPTSFEPVIAFGARGFTLELGPK